MKDIEITLYAKVEDGFDLIRFWDAIQGDQTGQWMRVFNPGYREIPNKALSNSTEEGVAPQNNGSGGNGYGKPEYTLANGYKMGAAGGSGPATQKGSNAK